MPNYNCPPGTHPTYLTWGDCAPDDGGSGSGGTLSDDQWYQKNIASHPEIYDTGISKEQWIAWRQFWDDKAGGFRSENVDANGNPISGIFAKPVDCPDGTTKYGQTQCLPLGDPRLSGGGGGKGKGGGAPPPAPTPSPFTAKSQLDYTGNELQDALAQMFNFRSGIFGVGNPNLSGATPRTPTGKGAEDISGLFLPGGGLWWGQNSVLSSALAPFGPAMSVQPSATTPSKSPSSPPVGCDCSKTYSPGTDCYTQCGGVTGGPAAPPVPFVSKVATGPLAAALGPFNLFR